MNIAVIIPCYRVKRHILEVLSNIGPEVSRIFIVDDACPEQTGNYVQESSEDSRIEVVTHEVNQGVGGATISGYQAAVAAGVDIIVKLDGDGQMDPSLIPALVRPIERGDADYCKGNRFFRLESLSGMPALRLIGNSALSFITKASSGYWNLMDPTNGFTAIHSKVVKMLPLQKLEHGFFFESDMLFRLNTIRAVVKELPMQAVYQDEISNLHIARIATTFPAKHLVRFLKRIFYNYYLRGFNPCSIELIVGSGLLIYGTVFGLEHWQRSIVSQVPTPLGTIMVAALSVILGVQMLLAALSFDVGNIPKEPLHPNL